MLAPALRRFWKPTLLRAALFVGLAATCQPASAALIAVVDTSSGEFFLKNDGGSFVFFDAYEITSASADLIPGDWTSVAGNYDSTGDGSVSPGSPWFVLSSTASVLAEAGNAVSGAIDPGETVSLGEIWSTAGVESLGFRSFVNTTESVLSVDFRSLAGDYDGDLDVDAFDYVVWSSFYGSTTNLAADGNGDGIVNAADYTVWRDDFVAAGGAPSPAFSFAAALVVPEPSALIAVLVTATALVPTRRR